MSSRTARITSIRDPLLEAVDLGGAHDLRHTFATWLEDAGIPGPGHRRADGAWSDQQRGSAMGPATGTPLQRWPPGPSTPSWDG